jgi:hypothetical protein
MRKWLLLLLAIALIYTLPKINTRGRRRASSLLKRIDEVVTVLVAALLAVYLGAFLYWLLIR